MNRICIILILLTFAFTARVTLAAPELPNPKFLPELVDGVGKWYLNFETLPGYHYIVEESQDLETWTPAPSGSFYGNGNTQRLYICDGPMWEDTPSSGGGQMPAQGMWQLRNLYMKLEMQSGNTGLVQRLSRASYTPVGETEALPAWDKALTLNLPAQTARFRYFPMLEWDDVATRTMYWVGLQVVITDNPAPAESLAPTAEEDADLNVFSHLESQLIGQLLAAEGPPQPPESHPHKFARVRRSEIDVNGNGLWDWWELLYNWNPFALQGQPGYCDPNADDDGDGSSNAQEQAQGTNPNVRDTDGDGSIDGQDTAPNDPNVTPLSQVEVWRSADPYFGWVLPGTYFNMGSGIQWITSPVNPPGISTGTETFYEQILGEQFVSYFPTFPSESLAQWISSGKFGAESTGDYMAFFPDEENSVQGGHYRATKIKLVQRPARPEPTKRSYVLVKRAVKWDADTSGAPSNYNPPLESNGSLPLDSGDPEVVTLVIPANATESPEYDLSGTFTEDATYPGGQQFKWSLLPMEVLVNDTAEAQDDIVRKEQKIGTIGWRQWIPCTVKAPIVAGLTSIGVTAEDGTMKFSNAQSLPGETSEGEASLTLTLDAQGQSKFWITGITQSANKGDAKLQIRKNGAAGDLLVTKPMTVFWFDTKITAKAENAAARNVTLHDQDQVYGIAHVLGIYIKGSSSVVPSGLDHNAKQISEWELGLIQNVTSTRTRKATYVDNGVIKKVKGVFSVTDSLDTMMESIFLLDQAGIGDISIFKPERVARAEYPDPPRMEGNVPATYQGHQLTWVSSEMNDNFTIWSVIVKTENGDLTSKFVPLKQNSWKIHAISSQANQTATESANDGIEPTSIPNITVPQ